MKKIFTPLAFTLIAVSLKAQYGQPCTDLFISEYVSPQGSGTSGNKTIEIYNPSSTPKNLSGYVIKTYANGSCTPGTAQFHFPNKNLAAGDVYVINNGSGTVDPAVIAARDTTWGSLTFTGNDAIFLISPTGDTLDIFGASCYTPTVITAWHIGANDSSRYITLVRKPTVHNGQRNFAAWQTEWTGYAANTYSYLGSHSMNACSTTTPQVSFTMPAQSVYESAGLLNIPIVLNSSCPNTVTVDVQVAFGTATLGSDYTYTNQTLTFVANSTSPQYDTIRIIDDALVESTDIV